MGRRTIEDVASAVANLEDAAEVQDLVREALSEGVSAADVLENGLRRGLERVGGKYEACEYFLSELMFSVHIMNVAMEVLEPQLAQEHPENRGNIVLGTVRGDIHDVGKNIFKMVAISSGFKVLDLGVDVESRRYVEGVEEGKATIVGVSALLTTALPEVENVVRAVREARPRENVKVIIGGNAVTKEFAKKSGADDAALDAVDGVNKCREWAGK